MDRPITRCRRLAALMATSAVAVAVAAVPAARAATPSPTPKLGAAVHYLATAPEQPGGATLAADGHYEGSPGFADFGLTIDGAYGLAAAHADPAVLGRVVAFVAGGTDGSGQTVEDWTGTAPGDEVDGAYPYASSGAVGKEALLAEMVGDDPRAFGGQNLIALLDSEVCSAPTTSAPACAGAGNYDNADSTFDQALGVLAQERAGDATGARAPVAFLARGQQSSGAWSSCIPSCGDADVDSTAMAVMALRTAPGVAARATANRGIAWIASRQESDGGFPGASGDSVNSTALAIMALRLAPGGRDGAAVTHGLGFLAAEQNADGGFDIAAGDAGSNLRASTQGVSGVVGTSFGTVSDPLG